MKLRATLVVEYEGDPAHYGGTTDPVQMAVIDAEQWTADPTLVACCFEPDEFDLTVEPVDAQSAAA